MTFVNDNNEILDVEGDLVLTKQAVSFFKFTINGDYSVNFTVPKNSETCNVLGYYGPQMNQQVAFTKQSFNAIDSQGNYLTRGSIVIQDDDGVSLNCFFVSGNSNWINLLQGLITELDYTGITSRINYETIISAGGIGYRNNTSGTIYPLVDWCFKYNKGANYYNGTFVSAGYNDSLFIQPEALGFQFYPCFYLKTLVEEIASQNGLRVAGNILTNKLYQSAVLTPSDGELKRDYDYSLAAFGPTISITSAAAVSTGFVNNTIDQFGWLVFGSTILYTPTVSAYIVMQFQYTCTDNIQVVLKDVGNGTVACTIAASGGRNVSNTGAVNFGRVYRLEITDAAYAGAVNFKLDRLDIFLPQKLTNALDYIRPDFFLPAIKQIDILKYIIQSFGCVAYYDEFSKTVTINSIESLQREAASDWSEYYISHRSEYTVQAAKHNYLRVEDGDEIQITSYNRANNVKFGEADLLTGNQLKESIDVFKSPFGATGFGLSKNGFYQPAISLVDFEEVTPQQTGNTAGGPVTLGAFTSITGSTWDRFNGSAKDATNPGSFSGFHINEVVRIVVASKDYGYFMVSAVDALFGWIECFGLLGTATSTGQIYQQKTVFKKITPRVLLIQNLTVTDYSTQSGFINGVNYANSFYTPFPIAYYIKSKTNLPIDNIKDGLHYDNPNIQIFTDPGLKSIYFNKIGNIFDNPTIRMQMLIPKAVFQSFEFDRFIYVKSAQLTGYFFVESIVNYVDGKTPVEVNVYML